MKLALAPIAFAAAALAQGPAASLAQGPAAAMPVGGAAMEMPSAAMPSSQISNDRTVSPLARLASYFDLSHVSSSITTTPVLVAHVFDPSSGKFALLASSVMRAGEGYYIPVCPTDVIAQAGSTPAMALQPRSCGYGVQLTPLPQNAARSLYKAIRTLFRAILSTASAPSTGPSTVGPAGSSMVGPGVPGMMQPGIPGMAQPSMAQPGMAQPGMTQPGMAQPGMVQPGMPDVPGMMQSGMNQPSMPGMAQPGKPGMSQMSMPGMNQPGTPSVPNMVGMPEF